MGFGFVYVRSKLSSLRPYRRLQLLHARGRLRWPIRQGLRQSRSLDLQLRQPLRGLVKLDQIRIRWKALVHRLGSFPPKLPQRTPARKHVSDNSESSDRLIGAGSEPHRMANEGPGLRFVPNIHLGFSDLHEAKDSPLLDCP